jgi:hypothetical protein
MKKAISCVSLALLVLACGTAAMAQSIVGVWQLTEQKTSGSDAKTSKITQPSMYMFTKEHYSIIRVSSDKERPIIDSNTATADELRDVFVESFVANAGKYDIQRGELWFWPTVAKSPTVMMPGSHNSWSLKIRGNTMTITSKTANDYPVKDPITYTLKRVE